MMPDRKPYSFVLHISARNAKVMKNWGDYYFALGLNEALERLGHSSRISPRNEWERVEAADEIDIVICGRSLPDVRRGKNYTLYWTISAGAPSIEDIEIADHIFVAGKPMIASASSSMTLSKISFLPQAFDAARMPTPTINAKREGIVFVGILTAYRRIVDLAVGAGYDVNLWGNGWRNTVAEKHLISDRISNDELGNLYSTAEIVLNDQKTRMMYSGIVSNRIFDALACGAPVITIPTGDLIDNFKEYVEEVQTVEEFTVAVEKIRGEPKEKKEDRIRFAKKMREEHSFDVRARQIISKVDSLVTAATQE